MHIVNNVAWMTELVAQTQKRLIRAVCWGVNVGGGERSEWPVTGHPTCEHWASYVPRYPHRRLLGLLVKEFTRLPANPPYMPS